MQVLKKRLEFLDKISYEFLIKNPIIFPLRWRKFFAMYFPDARVRKIFWSTLGVYMGENTYANLGFKVVKNDNESTKVEIGNNVSIACNVVIVTHSTPNNSNFLRNQPYVKNNLIQEKSVKIEDDAWLGVGAIILPGVVVGKGAIIGAGSVVREDVPPFSIVAGVPARLIRSLDEEKNHYKGVETK